MRVSRSPQCMPRSLTASTLKPVLVVKVCCGTGVVGKTARFWLVELMDTFGRVPSWSLSVMVPAPVASASVALVAPIRLTLKVSVGSAAVSLTVVTDKVWVVVPGAKLRVTPVRAV